MSAYRDGMPFQFRRAGPQDLAVLVSLDGLAVTPERRSWIQEALDRQVVMLCAVGAEACAYGVLENTFFGHAFVSLVYVTPSWRRQGAGMALLAQLCGVASTPKVFSSTNLSNAPMHALFRRTGWEVSGLLQHLEEGDPEVVYVRLGR